MTYVIRDGKIQTKVCQVNAVLHCNLSCRACASLSPVSKRYYADPEKVYRDFSILGKYYHAECLGIFGGEPLLHPHLTEVIDAAVKSGTGNYVRVVTNGILLGKMDDSFWERVNEVLVSLYAGKEMTMEDFRICEAKANKHNVDLRIIPAGLFSETFSTVVNKNEELVRRIYGSCLVAHTLRCHTVHEGYFHKCSESIFFPAYLKDFPSPTSDGIKIEDRAGFWEDLLAYLESEIPLKTCSYCLGSVGKRFAVEQIHRKIWWETQKRPVEDMINMDTLLLLEWMWHLYRHALFVEDFVKNRWTKEDFHSTFFGQLFYLERRKSYTTCILY